jgi:hypothetical protein
LVKVDRPYAFTACNSSTIAAAADLGSVAAMNRPPDHNVAGPGLDRFRWSHRPRLIVLGCSCRCAANSWRDDLEIRTARGADRCRFLRRGHDAIEPGVLSHSRQRHHLVEQGSAHTDACERRIVHAGEDR